MERSTSRRSFLNNLLLSWFGLLVLPVIYIIGKYIYPPILNSSKILNIAVAKIGDLAPNTGKLVKFGQKPVMLVRTSSGQYRAYSAVCTHLGCTITYKPGKENFYCNCHGGTYNLDGKVIAGPPPKPLHPYKVSLRDDQIVLTNIIDFS